MECAMTADRKWVERNLGFDPISTPPPAAAFTVERVAASAVKRSAKVAPEDFQREIIDFDSEAPEGREFVAFGTATGLSRFTDIPWPKGLAPQTGPKPKGTGSGPLPKADVLVVTWTVDEGHALSRVLTPGKDSRNDYVSYTKKFRKGAPALQGQTARRLLNDDDRQEIGRGLQVGLPTCRRTARKCRTSTSGVRSSRK
jgi:hypothetical protein